VTVPQSVQKLLEVFKYIEQAFLTKKGRDSNHGNRKAGDSSKKKMVSFGRHIPKKCFTDVKY
jgi:hypothetical protein